MLSIKKKIGKKKKIIWKKKLKIYKLTSIMVDDVTFLRHFGPELREKCFFGANFSNIARMRNYTDFVKFLEKSLESFFF